MSVTVEQDHDLETRREARFNCRTTPTNLLVLKKAASLAGLSVSQFVMNASLDAAYDLIQNRHHTVLSRQDWAVLTEIGKIRPRRLRPCRNLPPSIAPGREKLVDPRTPEREAPTPQVPL